MAHFVGLDKYILTQNVPTMKNAIAFGILLIVFMPLLNAQIPANTIMLGAGAGVGMSEEKMDISTSPRFGFFPAADFALGLGMNHRARLHAKQDEPNFEFDTEFAIFGRYYFLPESEWRPFLHAEVQNIPASWRFQTEAALGVAYFVSPRLSLEAQMMFGSFELFRSPQFSRSGIQFGVHVFFPPKKSS